ncbi:MAG: heavy-metal-associated domain-containing protein [Firmicutes bacterium]|nr:heavy-metal-associated domain-containing protein [Bacillota bacterium]
MAVLKVADMHCEMCVKRITNTLTEAGLDFAVSLENKTVTVNGESADVQKAISELDDIGFEAVEA